MDKIAIATIASGTVALLVPYLKSVGEEIAKKAGEQLGSNAGEVVWSKVDQLYEKVRTRFSSKPDALKVINVLEKSPDDNDTQATVRFYLKEAMESDEEFAKELAYILKDASEVGVDTVFQTTIIGNVQKLVQMGNVYGTVKI